MASPKTPSSDPPAAPPESARGSGRKRKRRVRVRKPASARSRRSRAALWGGIALGALVLLGVALAIALTVFARRRGPGEGQRFIVEVPSGASTREIAQLLTEAGVVQSEQLMFFYLASAPGSPVAGEHILLGGSTPSELSDCLTRSPSRNSVKLTVPEGFHRFAIAERVEKLGIASKESFLGASADPILLEALGVPSAPGRSPESSEGYLFPATYELKLDTPAGEVVERLVTESHVRWRRIAAKHEEAIARLASSLGWSRAEIITMASIVEKEAAVDEERSIVASVFENRLLSPSFTPKLLQSDPTSGYGCLAARDEAPSCASYVGKITPAINRDKLNRYSTYTREGLPPGPIANPGERSIKAVLEPADTKYLFFVAIGGGKHKFSETLEEHNRAVHR